MEKGDKYCYARILPSCGTYEIEDMIINTIKKNYFTGVVERNGRTLMFNTSDIGQVVFPDEERMVALKMVSEAEEKYIKEEKENKD